MKSFIALLLALLLYTTTAQSQSTPFNEEAFLQSIDAVIEDTAEVNALIRPLGRIGELNPVLNFQIYQRLLVQARKSGNTKGEAEALSTLGYSYRMMGNTVKSLEFALEAVRIANISGDTLMMAKSRRVLAHNYKDQGQHAKAIALYKWTEKACEQQHEYREQALALMNLGQVYLNMEKLDSALMFAQRAYEYLLQHNSSDFSPAVLNDLGQIHSKLGNKDLAESYFKMSIERGQKQGNIRFLSLALTGLAKHHFENQQLDSATVYAKRAIATVQNTAYSNFALQSAQLLSTMYETTNNDSTLKYLKIYIAANDSLYNSKNIQQTQTLTFENELKQQEIEAAKEQERQQRSQNIQFALIGFGIISFIIIFLLLSRSIITNTRLISFLGVVALLIVFEFLNLLLHPFLERITHHNPALMLLALVCIAAMLVPLHHRLEKWATAKLVEKNKQIRLAAAKRTIEQLEQDKNQNQEE